MAVPKGYFHFLKEAFLAKPSWLMMPPHLLVAGAFGVLGFLNPGFWLLGAGLELAYLHLLASHPRFRKWVESIHSSTAPPPLPSRIEFARMQLQEDERVRFDALRARARTLHEQLALHAGSADAVQSQREAMEQLLWIAMRLLQTRSNLDRFLESTPALSNDDVALIEAALDDPALSTHLRTSYQARLQLAQQRREAESRMSERYAYLESELTRITHQMELIGQQGLLTRDHATDATQLNEVAATVEAANHWLAEQQAITGSFEPLIETPPSLLQ